MPDDGDSGKINPDFIGSGVAHDLANTLAAAIASVRLVTRKTDPDEVRELSEIVLRQLEKAATLIREASSATEAAGG
jgi:hypothetical protein